MVDKNYIFHPFPSLYLITHPNVYFCDIPCTGVEEPKFFWSNFSTRLNLSLVSYVVVEGVPARQSAGQRRGGSATHSLTHSLTHPTTYIIIQLFFLRRRAATLRPKKSFVCRLRKELRRRKKRVILVVRSDRAKNLLSS